MINIADKYEDGFRAGVVGGCILVIKKRSHFCFPLKRVIDMCIVPSGEDFELRVDMEGAGERRVTIDRKYEGQVEDLCMKVCIALAMEKENYAD